MSAAAKALEEGRARLGAACDELGEVAVALEQDVAPFEEAREAVAAVGVRVVVVGEVNRGKSTFLNALLGRRLFPSRVVVCTAVVTELQDGDLGARAHYRDGSVEDLELDPGDLVGPLRQVVSKKNAHANELERVQLWCPNQFARNGVVLVDTPGVNDPVEWREELTRTAVSRADAAIFLLDPQTPLRQSERVFIQEAVHHRVEDRVLFVVSKKDQVNDEELREALNRIEHCLEPIISKPRVLAVASKPALESRLEGSASVLASTGFPEFEAELERFLVDERIELQVTARKRALRGLADLLVTDIELRRRALRQERGDLERRLHRAQATLHRQRSLLAAELEEQRHRGSRMPDEVSRRLADAWREAERQHLVSDGAVVGTLAALRESHDAAREEIRERVGLARRAAERGLDGRFHELRKGLEAEATTQLALVSEALAVVRTDLAPPASTLLSGFSTGALQFAGEAIQIQGRAELPEILVRHAVGLGAALLGIASGALGLLAGMASEFAGWDPSPGVRRALRLASRAGLTQLQSDVEGRARQMVRRHQQQLERTTERQLAAAASALRGVERSVSMDERQVEEAQRRLEALADRVRTTLESLA